MPNINFEAVEKYVREKSQDENFSDLKNYAKENHVPIITDEVANFLRTLIRYQKPLKILEIGTAIGYSALVMEKAFAGVEKILTLEKNEEIAKIAKANLQKYNATEKIEILPGDALEILPKIEEKFDFIFIDAQKSAYQKYFEEAIRLSKKGSIIVCDNVLFKGMVADEELADKKHKTIVKNLRKFIDFVMEREESNSSLIPLGDGILLIMRD